MLVKNISGQARFIASPTHDYESDDVEDGASVEVPDKVGRSLVKQVDVWAAVKAEPAKNTTEAAAEGDDK